MKSPSELVQLEKRGAQGQPWKPSIFRKKKKRVEENQPRNMRREQIETGAKSRESSDLEAMEEMLPGEKVSNSVSC